MDKATMDLLAAAGVDAEALLERVMGSEKLAIRFLRMFTANAAPYEGLRRAVAAGDWAGAVAASHDLKGMSGNVSLTRLHALFTRQVDLLRAGDNAGAAALMPDIEAAYAAAADAIARL